MRLKQGLCLTGFVLLAVTGGAQAGKLQIWRQDSAKDFLTGERTRVVAGSDGKLRLARQITTVGAVASTQLWAVCTDGKGGIVAGVGNPGAVLRIDANGKVDELLKDEKAQFFALTVAADGAIYAASAPGGSIRRIDAQGKSSEFAATQAAYVWALARDAAGNLYAATGLPAQVVRFDRSGKSTTLLRPRVSHVLSLAVDASGTVFAGTSDRGLIYRIAPDGKAFVLYDAPQADVKVLTLDATGTLYAGTAASAKSAGGSSGRGSESSIELTARTEPAETSPVHVAVQKSGGNDSSKAKSDLKTQPVNALASAPAFAGPASSGENSVYRISADGAVDEVFREKTLVLGIAVKNDRLIVGTGHEGRIYEVDLKASSTCEWARLEHGDISALTLTETGDILCAGANPGKLYRLEDRFVDKGEILSAVHDAKMLSRWGKHAAEFATPGDTRLELDFRCGNVAKPDDTWSAWSIDSSNLPAARYCQSRARLYGPEGSNSPTLSSVQVHYATLNRPPTVESIEVPDLVKSPVVGPAGKLKLKWKATDPNGDALMFAVAIKKDGWPDWVVLAKDLTANEFDWDAQSAPSGNYQLRVEVSDRPANPDGDARTAAKTSDAFVIDRSAPAVRLVESKTVARTAVADFEASDSQTRLTAAAFSVDGKTWTPLFPDSGLFDGRSTRLIVRTEKLDPGLHLLLIRVEDSAGNTGVADTVIRVD